MTDTYFVPFCECGTESEGVKKMRGDVINKFAKVDFLVSRIVCDFHTGGDDKYGYDFMMHDLMCHPLLNFIVKVDALDSIYLEYEKKLKFNVQSLRRISEIRNHFAHCWPEEIVHEKKITGGFIRKREGSIRVSYKRKDCGKTAKELFSEFMDLAEKTIKDLESLKKEVDISNGDPDSTL
jgi:hypothetical protein